MGAGGGQMDAGAPLHSVVVDRASTLGRPRPSAARRAADRALHSRAELQLAAQLFIGTLLVALFTFVT